MKSVYLSKYSDDELVERFKSMAHQAGEAVVNWLPAAKKTDQLFAVKRALRNRGPEARLKLAPLLKNSDRFVRYYAATELYGLLPQQCRPIVEANTRESDAIAGDARGFLRAIDEGSYRPE
jgi:hypothetical protein